MNKNKKKKKAHSKFFCSSCLYSAKGASVLCPKCKAFTCYISHKLHLPSMKASKTRWKEFIKATDFIGWLSQEEDKAKVKKKLGL